MLSATIQSGLSAPLIANNQAEFMPDCILVADAFPPAVVEKS